MNEWKCRDCEKPITGQPHLRVGRALTRGSNGICLDCADLHMAKLHVSSLHELVPAYIKANKAQTETAELRDRVRQLESILSDPKALERLLDSVTTPNQGWRPHATTH